MFRNRRLSQQILKYGKKCFSTQPAVSQDSMTPKLSVLSNGLRVASFNESAPVAQFVLLVNAGSRDESPLNLGVTHCLQCSAGLTGSKNTAFLTTQLMSSLGADLKVTAGREHTLYSVRCPPSVAQEVFTDVVAPAIMSGKFPWWEVAEVYGRMQYQKAVAESDTNFVLMENAHKASFHGSLGNSVLSPDYMLGKHTSEMLRSKFDEAYTLGNIVLAGSGLNHDMLVEIGTSIDGLGTGSSVSRSQSKFVSSEVHVGQPSDLVQAAVTFNGVALNDKDAIALGVLQHALGTEGNIKWGSQVSQGVLNAAVEKATNAVFSTSAFSANYSDAGLFGVHVVSPQTTINQVLHAAVAECKNVAAGSLTGAQVEAAKARFKAAVLMDSESMANVTEDLAVQTAILGTVASTSAIGALIDGVTSKHVNDVAKRVLGGKKSLATVGRAFDGPFLQDL